MTAPAIAARGLTMRFPIRRQLGRFLAGRGEPPGMLALDGVDLDVWPGEVLGLLGPNGAGKTTLLKILATLLLPTSGGALVGGHDVVRAPAAARRVLGYCLDSERSFYYRLSGTDNLRFFAALNNLPAREAAARIAAVLGIVGLDAAVREAPFMTYSRGMRERLGLARALLADPAVLLLDEPTKGLDPGGAAHLRRFLRERLARDLGKTILLVTHALDEARECCDRVAFMERGRILFTGAWPEAAIHIERHGLPGCVPAGAA